MVARGTSQPQDARDQDEKAEGVAAGMAPGCVAEVIRVGCSLLLPDGRI